MITDCGLYEIEQRGARRELRTKFHAGQLAALNSPFRVTAVCAGSQSGKTSLIPFWIYREMLRHKGGDHLIVSPSYDLFKLRLLPTLQDVLEDALGIARFHAADRVMEIREGARPDGKFLADTASGKMWARLILRSADAPGGLESATAVSAALDEAGQDAFSLAAWKAVKRRLAISRGRVLITTTLYNLGWLVSQVVQRAEQNGVVRVEWHNGAELTITDNKGADIRLIQYDSIINPLFPLAEYEEARQSMDDAEFSLFYRGRVAQPKTLVYNCFDRAANLCPVFSIPKEWRRFVGLDFGDVNTAAIFVAEEPGTKRLFVYDEYWQGGKTCKEHGAAILSKAGRIPDAYGGAASEGQWRREFQAGGLPVRKPEVPELGLGITIVFGEIKNLRLIFFESLENTLEELGKYRRKRDKDGKATEEIEHKADFHLLDSLRYVVSSIRSDRGVWSIPMAAGRK